MALPVLRKGDKQSMVRELQRLLNRALRPSPGVGRGRRLRPEDRRGGEAVPGRVAAERRRRGRPGHLDGPQGGGRRGKTGPAGAGGSSATPSPGSVATSVTVLDEDGQAGHVRSCCRGACRTRSRCPRRRSSTFTPATSSVPAPRRRPRTWESGKRVILGLGVTISTRSGRQGIYGVYNDRFVVLWEDSAGKHAKEFVGTTQSSAKYEDQGPGKKNYTDNYTKIDADGDGRGDLGRLKVGTHTFEKSTGEEEGERPPIRRGPRSARRARH